MALSRVPIWPCCVMGIAWVCVNLVCGALCAAEGWEITNKRIATRRVVAQFVMSNISTRF